MTGLCGWFNSGLATDNASVTIDAMRAQLRPVSIAVSCRADNGAAIATAGGTDDSGFFEDGQVWIAFHGHPMWPASTWARRAAEQGNAATLAALYRDVGMDLPKQVRGPVTIAVIDHTRRTALLANDRMGIHTLYYALKDGALVFGTTLGSLLAYPSLKTGLDSQSIFNYLYFHTVPAPRSIYAGIQRLLPGEQIIFDGREAKTHFFWQAPYTDNTTADSSALKQEFHTLLRNAVAQGARDGHVGAFLSGGTDSSTVAGMLAQLHGEPVDTYSIGFDAPGFDETEYARIAARHFGTRPHEYYVTPEDVCNAVPLIAAAYDEPFGNASAVPTYYCARLAASDGVMTLLAGDGGDEVFAGNARYAKQKIFEVYNAVPAALRMWLVEPLVFNLPGARSIGPLRKLRSYIEQARVPLPDRLETYNFLHTNPLADILSPDFLAAIDATEPLSDLRGIYHRTSSRAEVNRLMHIDLKVTLSDNDLRKVERMTEIAGVRACYPLLDQDLVDFAARIPADVKLKGRELRHFFKDALKDFLPPQILTKRKHGFGLPFGLWLKDHAPLRELAYDSLSTLRQRGWLNPHYIDRLLHLHQTSHSTYYGTMIWVLMMFEQWLQHHQDATRT